MTAVKIGPSRELLRGLAAGSVQCVVTSPPYWGLRDYQLPPLVWADGWRGSLGLEPTPELYVEHMVEVFREVRRVLRDDGTLWLNMGDSYASQGGFRDYGSHDGGVGRASTGGARPAPGGGLKPKDLCGIPWRLAFALQADGWWLRSDIIWSKSNPMPESVRDRPTKSHEYVFLLSKSKRYYYDQEAVREANQSGPSDIKKMREQKDRIGGKNKTLDDSLVKASKHTNIGRKRSVGDPSSGRNRRSVWRLPTQPFKGAHFATFPEKLVEPCILAATSERGCCPSCGKPWVRVIERTSMEVREGKKGRVTRMQCSGTMTKAPEARTTGWRPGCDCPNGHPVLFEGDSFFADPIPCTVLDPFAGSGTVGVVAKRLGRDYILLELNPEYAAMAEHRLAQVQPRLI